MRRLLCWLVPIVMSGSLALAETRVEVERVLAVVNGVPVLASDVEIAAIARLVPREGAESEHSYRRTIVNALIALELRWQDLHSAGVVARLQVDVESAWAPVVERAGGLDSLGRALAEAGLELPLLRELVRRAAVVEAYVAGRFGTFVAPTASEIERAYREEFLPTLPQGATVPELKSVRSQLEAILRERKLLDEVERWTRELEARGDVVRYLR